MAHYVSGEWFNEDVQAWAREGIDAAEGAVWKVLGIRPSDAGRVIRQGSSLADTVRDWWHAGIPIGEVAVWIGAGLNAEEAAAQRAKGITAEHAAALRALRDDAFG